MPEAVAAPVDKTQLAAVVRHLAHELRQPLSGIESIAYYLEMVLPGSDERVHSQIARLRQMVQQASWVLDDAAHAVRAAAPEPSIIRLDQLVMRLTADLQVHDEYNLHVNLAAPRAAISIDPRHAQYVIATLLDFFRNVAQCTEPVTIRTCESRGILTFAIDAHSAQGDPNNLRRLLDPHRLGGDCDEALPLGSLRQMIEANGGSFRVDAQENSFLRVEIEFATTATTSGDS